MKQAAKQMTTELIDFIAHSQTAFQCVETLSACLTAEGFTHLHDGDDWTLEAGKGYFVTRNLSAIVAFRMPKATPTAFRITASHSDSPTFALKDAYESESCGHYLRLNTERYGGMILSSWLDRPLSIAGRVVVRENDRFTARPVALDKDLILIPNVAIHQNRAVNDGYKYNPASDMMPLFGDQTAKGKLLAEIAEAAGVEKENIVSSDLYLYCRTPGTIWGADDVFFSAPRIDNLMCTFGALKGLLGGAHESVVPVLAVFDGCIYFNIGIARLQVVCQIF